MRLQRVKNILSCAGVFLLLMPVVVYGDQLYMLSQSGDYIGQGQEINIDSTTHTFSAQRNYDNGVSIAVNGATWWYLDFAAPGDVDLTQGLYENAARFPFQSSTQPGLDVSGNGRGCNTLTGNFTVLEVAYNADGTVSQFAADFEQHCDGAEPGLFGAIRINSTVPIDVTIPAVFAKAGGDRYAIDNQRVTLDGSGSYTSDGSAITAYEWSQITGPAVTLDDPTSVTPSFTAPIAPLGGVDLEFELRVTTSSGAVGTDTVKVIVSSKSDPQTFISMNSESGDYIGQGGQYYFTLNDGTIVQSSTDLDMVRVVFQGGNSWYYNFAAPEGTGLSEQLYLGATRYPFQDPQVPGMDVYGAGKGCNTLTGSFEVLDITRNSTNDIETLAVDFEQHCEGQAPALFGQVRYNYTDPSVPTADAGADQTVYSGQWVTLDATASTDSDGTIAGYQWQQIDGATVTLQGANTAAPTFIAPTVPLGSTQTVTLQVVVTDNEGYMASDTVTITVEGIDQLSYCDSRGQNTSFEWIDAVSLAGDNRASGNNQGYADFTAQAPIQLSRGDNTAVLTPGFTWGSYTEHWSIWIDLNQDGVFGTDELLLRDASRSVINGIVAIPADAASGPTRMRVSMRYNGKSEACGTFYYGEVEDYTVIVP